MSTTSAASPFTSQGLRQAKQQTESKIKGLLPAKYDTTKAVLGVVIALVLFGLGALFGSFVPWWVSLIVAVALGFGAFVGTAWLDSYLQCRPLNVKVKANVG